jgi:translation initiation factor IF-2
MTDSSKVTRLSKIAREFNVGISTIVEFLHKKGIEVDANPNTKITSDYYTMLLKEYSTDIRVKEESSKLELGAHRGKQESVTISSESKENDDDQDNEPDEVMVKDTSSHKYSEKEHVHTQKPASKPIPVEQIETAVETIKVTVVGKIDLEHKKAKQPVSHEKPEAHVKQHEKPIKEHPAKEVVKSPVEKTHHKAAKIEIPKHIPKDEAESLTETKVKEKPDEIKTKFEQIEDVKVVGRIDLDLLNQKTRPSRKTKEEKTKERKDREFVRKPAEPAKPEATATKEPAVNENFIQRKVERLSGPVVIGKIELPTGPRKDKPAGEMTEEERRKKKRKRIKKDKVEVKPDTANATGDRTKKAKPVQHNAQTPHKGAKRPIHKEVNEVDVSKQIKDTLARLTATKGKSKGSKHRRDKRDVYSQKSMDDQARLEADKNIIKVTEFVSVNELATMMNVAVNEVIGTCMNLGLFVSINQRLDAETMALVADEFGYKVEFVSAELLESFDDEVEEDEGNLMPRPPIVTVMGHVDHGKTSLLDYIRKTSVMSGEAGGITQHIGAYSVVTEDGKRISFLDTPGHEAFTAMRARGAQVTDIAIIIVAADDSIMPQTKEAINHAQAAGVPIIFAINKIDKVGANPEKIKEGLASMNLLVEEWGGKYQSQDISAKQGLNISELLVKVMLEAEMLDLKANPNRKATGTVIESSLDKGRGYVTTLLVQNGTLKLGDIMLAGNHTGHVKAMYNERGEQVKEAGPSTPVLLLGLSGAAQAGDKFNVMDSDRDAKDIANRRQQLAREQGLRTQKHITLDEIGRRIAIGNFQELNVIIKGDVDGSIEALADSLIKLSTEEIQVNVKHKAVGQISESDVLLAAASEAIILGFQVRPSMAARKLAEKEEIDIRLYSVIYDAINEVRDAMEGMLSPEIKEEIVASVEVREVFKITKVGTIAGCYVREGKIKRTSKIRIIREGIVVYEGNLGSLKRFKDDVKEVATGYECGLNIEKFNDIKEGDIIEAYEQVEVKRTL